jgi:hypothetical protein
VKRQETIPFEYVELSPDDLKDMASRIHVLYQQRLDKAGREYDKSTEDGMGVWQAPLDRRRREAVEVREEWASEKDDPRAVKAIAEADTEVERADRELAAHREDRKKGRAEAIKTWTSYWRPTFTVETKVSAFQDEDWANLSARLSTDEVQAVTMKGGGLATDLELGFSLVGRAVGGYQNYIRITSYDQGEFESEWGYFTNLMRKREARWRRRLTTGVVGAVIWFVLPAFFLTSMAVLAVSLATGVAAKGPLRLASALLVTIPVALFVSFAVLEVLARVAPRVTVGGVGPHAAVKEALGQIVFGIAVSAIVAVVAFVLPEFVK